METTQKGADTNFILHASHHLKSTQSTISIYLSPDDTETMVLATVLGINRRNNHKQNQEGICRTIWKHLPFYFRVWLACHTYLTQHLVYLLHSEIYNKIYKKLDHLNYNFLKCMYRTIYKCRLTRFLFRYMKD